MSELNKPFTTLGQHLKYVREQSEQSIAEVSGAVEIDSTSLERIESGIERPDEEILLLLISHFDVQEREAVQLWELADYGTDMPDQIKPDIDPQQLQNKSTIMLLAVDMRTMYSDGLEATSNAAGITMTFTQASGPNQVSPVARVGMSYEQAENVLGSLQHLLLQSKHLREPRQLPPSTNV